MALKRERDGDEDASAADSSQPPTKARKGFAVGPANLPDGTWRRKVTKIKKDLIHKAKVKKSYARLKAQEPIEEKTMPADETSNTPPQLHPERQAMLDTLLEEEKGPDHSQPREPSRRRERKPRDFEKERANADQRKQEAEARREEFARRDKERKDKLEERERFRKAMAKARTGGKNGQRKLGTESEVLLSKVRKMVGS